jgi:ketosteroid isomerase-like protein
MSEENVEIVRAAFEHFRRTGEISLDFMAPDVVLDNSNGIIDPGMHRGLESVAEYIVALGDIWSRQTVEPDELIAVGADRVVVAQRIISTGRDGIEVVARTAGVFTLERGKITHWKTFQTKQEALEAAGLSG